MEHFVICPYCGDKLWGCNAGDILNNLRIHFYHECDKAKENAK